jgi:hypothetical protein
MTYQDRKTKMLEIEKYDWIILANNLGMVVSYDSVWDRARIWFFSDPPNTSRMVYGNNISDLIIKNSRNNAKNE